jgi:hypothetical protein
MQKEGILDYKYGRATGFWAYNSGLSYWALRPVASEAGMLTFEAFATQQGFDPRSWPPLAPGF